jgi:hypothetical protein
MLELDPSGWRCVGLVIANTHKAQEGGFWWGAMLTLAMKPQWICYKLDETIEKPCSDLLAIHQRKCIHGVMEIL